MSSYQERVTICNIAGNYYAGTVGVDYFSGMDACTVTEHYAEYNRDSRDDPALQELFRKADRQHGFL